MMAIKCCLVTIIVVACTAVILSDNSNNSQENYPLIFDQIHHTSMTRYIPLGTTLEGLQRFGTENIVRGRILNDARMVLQFSQFRPDEIIMGHIFVSLEILEVFKGNLSVGDVITLAESYYIADSVLITHANYLPSIPYQEYFFFLSGQRTNPEPEEFAGIFWTMHDYRSRFPVPDSRADMSRLLNNVEDLVLATSYISNLPMTEARLTVNEIYMNLWQEVIEVFMDWRRPPIPSYRFQADNISSQEVTQHDFDGVR